MLSTRADEEVDAAAAHACASAGAGAGAGGGGDVGGLMAVVDGGA